MAMRFSSTSFDHETEIPVRHTCEGEDVSPPLVWTDVPQGTRAMALIVDDPDAPDPRAPKTTWVHWVLYNLPASPGVLPEALLSDELPSDTREGRNDWRHTGYRGPCPPIGRHRYYFKLYALDAPLAQLGPSAGKKEVEAAMQGHILESATLIGTYQKRGR
jgi:Raf kinase inhibitor-like YbhB/YbcL family protein